MKQQITIGGISFVKTDTDSPDAQSLLQELNETLIRLVGHNGMLHVSFEDFRLSRAFFLVGYDNGEAVCCAGLREDSERTAEIKRVYARKNSKGIGSSMMLAIEELAKELGYDRLVLECRDANTHAIAFYQKCGFSICDNYPPYVGVTDAVCLSRSITLED